MRIYVVVVCCSAKWKFYQSQSHWIVAYMDFIVHFFWVSRQTSNNCEHVWEFPPFALLALANINKISWNTLQYTFSDFVVLSFVDLPLSLPFLSISLDRNVSKCFLCAFLAQRLLLLMKHTLKIVKYTNTFVEIWVLHAFAMGHVTQWRQM